MTTVPITTFVERIYEHVKPSGKQMNLTEVMIDFLGLEETRIRLQNLEQYIGPGNLVRSGWWTQDLPERKLIWLLCQ